jgi:uncharacterized membrane protein YfcA
VNYIRIGLLAALATLALAFVIVWARRANRSPPPFAQRPPSRFELALGFVTNFFDTLGIGSFAPTTAVIRAFRLMPDEALPGTLNIGHAIPTIVQALIFITVIEVDPKLLLAMIVAAICGSWLGARVVVGLDRRAIQLGMGLALLVAAAIFVLVNLGLLPSGGMALGLDGWRFWFALSVNFVLGALMTLGVGNYGPCLITLSLLGMNPASVFPIMAASSAFLMPVASLCFLRSHRYQLPTGIALTLGGIPGVLVAAYLVKSLPLVGLRWLVAVVVTFVALSMVRSAMSKSPVEPATDTDRHE